MIQPKLLI